MEDNTESTPQITGETSDGYHTFNELYEHRHSLFAALMTACKGDGHAWISRKHNDGTEMGGWFIAGLKLTGVEGDITYHIPSHLWDLYKVACGWNVLPVAPKWDGATSFDSINRLRKSVMSTA